MKNDTRFNTAYNTAALIGGDIGEMMDSLPAPADKPAPADAMAAEVARFLTVGATAALADEMAERLSAQDAEAISWDETPRANPSDYARIVKNVFLEALDEVGAPTTDDFGACDVYRLLAFSAADFIDWESVAEKVIGFYSVQD